VFINKFTQGDNMPEYVIKSEFYSIIITLFFLLVLSFGTVISTLYQNQIRIEKEFNDKFEYRCVQEEDVYIYYLKNGTQLISDTFIDMKNILVEHKQTCLVEQLFLKNISQTFKYKQTQDNYT
jgi:hypothetical protein